VKDFYCNVSKVGDLPHAWKEELSRARGVYLLSHSGERYVGKADGKRGFWGRWDEYRATEHGGNKLLEDYLDRNRDADFEVTVLWEAPPSATADDILREEARWKRKMQSKKWGLNGN
jgi:hypothetical protein